MGSSECLLPKYVQTVVAVSSISSGVSMYTGRLLDTIWTPIIMTNETDPSLCPAIVIYDKKNKYFTTNATYKAFINNFYVR